MPVIEIDAPQIVAIDQPFEVSATITDPNEVGIEQAEFFLVTDEQETLIGRVTEAPYEIMYPGLSIGLHSIVVKATDNDGNSADAVQSNLIAIDLAEPATLLTSPLNGERIQEDTPITFEAVAGTLNPDDWVTKVEFLVDNAVVGEAIEPPFTFVLEDGLAEGSYGLTSRVHTELEKSNDSNIANVLVFVPSEYGEEFNPYWTSWGTNNADMSELSDKMSTINLAFVGMSPNFELIGTDGLLQFRGSNTPDIVTSVDPTYMNWTTRKYEQPETNMAIAMGGAHETSTWELLKNPDKVAPYIQSLTDIVNDVFPVYELVQPSQYRKIGYVQIDGIDLDIESSGMESDPVWSDNIVSMIDGFTKENPNKIMMITGMHTAGDDPSCQFGGSFEDGCSYPAGSAYAGSLTLVLEGIQENNVALSKYQVMAYDAGRQGIDYDWTIALENIAEYLPKEDIILGVSIGLQWGPSGSFVESMDDIKAKALQQQELGYGGVMSWAVGALVGGRRLPSKFSK
ncbi:Ig-like domain-containing protein [Vibrio sp. 10N.247.311.51]|uniref:Ig-like domain-containing protein n=1 Tax=Vibrio sp. 10N.247.311.51 TaxID=3229996 RepID=UPI0035520E54